MKHFINILGLLILTFFAVGVTYLQSAAIKAPWGVLYIPLFIFFLMWGAKLNNDYKEYKND